MLLFKNIGYDNYENLDIICNKVPNSYIENQKMIVLDNNKIIAICFYEIIQNYCKINYVYMEDEDDLIKDGLIRTLINAMDIKGINKIIAKNARDNALYIRIGFFPLLYSDFVIKLNKVNNEYLIIDTKDFFDNTCCSK